MWVSDQEIQALGGFAQRRDILIKEISDLEVSKIKAEETIAVSQTYMAEAHEKTHKAKEFVLESSTEIAVKKALLDQEANLHTKHISLLNEERDALVVDIKALSLAKQELEQSNLLVKETLNILDKSLINAVVSINESVSRVNKMCSDFESILSTIMPKIQSAEADIATLLDLEAKSQSLAEYEQTLIKQNSQMQDFYNQFKSQYEEAKKELS